MEPDALAVLIDRRLRTAADPRRRERARWYTPTTLEPLGVTTPDLRAIVRDVGRHLGEADPARVVALALALVRQRTFEGRQAAYEVLRGHRAALATLRTRDVEELGRGMDNWATVDTFACHVSGRCWRAGQVPDGVVRRWARSRDLWWRRAALVSTVPLNLKSHGGAGDAKKTLDICGRLAAEEEPLVVKALSWALRALATRDRAAVERFLEAKDLALHPLVRREVKAKLRTGRKR